MIKTIVLIDDDPEDLDITKEALFNIDTELSFFSFTSSEDALSILTNELITRPDYIFIDITMPKVTGYECLQVLRKIRAFQNTSIILYSTTLPTTIAEKLKEMGASFTFQKPFRIADYKIILKPILVR
jgi:CheY-like chemotaxis protein